MRLRRHCVWMRDDDSRDRMRLEDRHGACERSDRAGSDSGRVDDFDDEGCCCRSSRSISPSSPALSAAAAASSSGPTRSPSIPSSRCLSSRWWACSLASVVLGVGTYAAERLTAVAALRELGLLAEVLEDQLATRGLHPDHTENAGEALEHPRRTFVLSLFSTLLSPPPLLTCGRHFPCCGRCGGGGTSGVGPWWIRGSDRDCSGIRGTEPTPHTSDHQHKRRRAKPASRVHVVTAQSEMRLYVSRARTTYNAWDEKKAPADGWRGGKSTKP